MRIQIGTGYYGITTLANPSSGASSLTEGFRQAFDTPDESLPEVVLSNTQSGSQPATSKDEEKTPQRLVEIRLKL
jgi:hypothetical protein